MFGKILIYLACLTLPFDAFPFKYYNLGSSKPLSLIFIYLFFLVNIFKITKFKFSDDDWKSFFFLFFSFIITLIKVVLYYKDYSPLITFINLFLSFFITYQSTIFIINMGDKKTFEIIKKSIVIGYSISLLIGLLQFITIYGGINIFNNLYPYILRDTEYISQGRIHFAFGEPSYIGIHLFLILLPLYGFIDIKNKRKYRLFLIMYYILSIFSFSMQFILDTIIFIVFYFLINKKIKASKKIGVITISIIVAIIIYNLFIANNYFNIENPFYHRIVRNINRQENIFDPNVYIQDQSVAVRTSLAKVGLVGIQDHPIVGYGLGYFGESYRENISKVNYFWTLNSELVKKYQDPQPCYVFYLNMLTEAGVLGLLFLIYFFKSILTRGNNPFFIFALMSTYFLIQLSLFGTIPIIIVIALVKYGGNSIEDLKKLEK